MNFQFSNKIKIFLSSLAVAVVLLLAVFSGISAGKKNAQAQILIQTAKNSAAAAQNFYRDQNRYPTPEEFGNQNLMLNYMTNFPPPNYVSSGCPQSYAYKRIDQNSFQLSFCLPVAFDNYQAGWNTINGSPAAAVN